MKKYKTEMVGVLLEKGSAIYLKDREGKSAWTYAFEMDNKPILKLLEKAGAVRDYKGMEWEGNVSKQAAEFIKVVDNQAEWSDLWKRAFEKPTPEMDFETYAVACVFLGYSAKWLYSISIGRPQQRGNQIVIPYALFDVMLRLSGPFKAGGQYHMLVVEKQKGGPMVMQQEEPSSKKRPGDRHLFE